MRTSGRERLCLLALAFAVFYLAIMADAGHSEPWHHNVKCFRCVERQVRGLLHQGLPSRMRRVEAQVEAQDQYISWLEERSERLEAKVSGLLKCLGEVPLSRYGEEQGPSGYVFNLNAPEGPTTLTTTALDITYPKDPVGAWVLVNVCNSDRVMPVSGSVQRGPVPTTRSYEASTQRPAFHWRRGR